MKRLIALGIFGVFLFFSVTIWAQVPQLLNYQGRLTDDKGIPIITTTTVRFSLYQGGDAATPGSGTLCYQEDASVTPDDNGVFNHLIGSGSIIYGALDATVFQTGSPVYLEIAIDPAGANETLLPRKQIVTVGYSFKAELADDADTVDGQDSSAFAPVVHHHDPDYVNEGQANSVNSAMIVNGTIVDADINAAANIAATKINTTGLDADLLDGVDSDAFVHTAGDDMAGTLTINTLSTYALYGKTLNAMGMGVYGYASAIHGTNYGVYGTTASDTDGASGVYAHASGTSGKVFGVHAISDSPIGYGVLAEATATTGVNFGLLAVSNSPDGVGVKGSNVATSGSAYGVHGRSDSTEGIAVYGEATADSGTNYGVYGKSDSPDGHGVVGIGPNQGVVGVADATEGTTYGVYGKTASTSDYAFASGVYGEATATSGTNSGVYGKTASSGPWASGVYGEATSTSGGIGVYGKSNSPDGYGVYAMAPNHPVIGYATASSGASIAVSATCNSSVGYGVYGNAPYCGVRGVATAATGITYGVYGESNSTYGYGVYGKASATTGSNYGVLGYSESSSGYGVYGACASGGYAGYFQGNAHVTGNFTVGGNKNCVQPIDNGKKVLLYAMESPEIWFEDFGSAQLVNGQAVVHLENVFTQAANTEIAYFVFPIPNGECNGLYISSKDKASFEVRELGDGTSNITFDYRIVAKRRGYEEVRFEEFTEPEQPSAEPNLPIAPKETNLKQPQRP